MTERLKQFVFIKGILLLIVLVGSVIPLNAVQLAQNKGKNDSSKFILSRSGSILKPDYLAFITSPGNL